SFCPSSSSTFNTFSFEKFTNISPSLETAYQSPAYLSDGLQAANSKIKPSKITIDLVNLDINIPFPFHVSFIVLYIIPTSLNCPLYNHADAYTRFTYVPYSTIYIPIPAEYNNWIQMFS